MKFLNVFIQNNMPVDSVLSQVSHPTSTLSFFIIKIHLNINDNIKKDIEVLQCEDVNGTELAYYRIHWEAFIKLVVTLRVSEVQKLHD